MNFHTIGDCHADRPWYFIDPSDTLFKEILCNSMHYTLKQFNHKNMIFDISKGYMRGNPFPTTDPEEIIKREKIKYPYMHNFDIKNNDAVLFAFGEIDCRLIFSFSGYSETWQQMANDSIFNYFEFIKANIENFTQLHTIVYNIIPPSRHKDFPTYPIEGTDELRRDVTLYVNDKFKEYCKKYNFIYFDIYDKHCDDEGFMIPELSDGANHIFYPVHHHEYLKKLKF